MSHTFALDPINHDLYLDENGQLALAPDPLGQRIEQRILTFRGEFWLDLSIGIDYIGTVFKRNPDLGTIRNMLSLEIQKVWGVKTIENLEVSLDRPSRKLSVTFHVTGTDDAVYFRTTEVAL